ncbi:conserved hypothetical protein [Vibrio phage 150E35-1]|nr:conserved hypothetical protein [Vibrio phage 150E35-1]
MSVSIKVFHRALHKQGQAKATAQGLESIRVADLHPNVKHADYWIASEFGVFINDKIKWLKSSDRDFQVDSIMTIHEVNEIVLARSAEGVKTTMIQEL